jgi:hypothetical protein
VDARNGRLEEREDQKKGKAKKKKRLEGRKGKEKGKARRKERLEGREAMKSLPNYMSYNSNQLPD